MQSNFYQRFASQINFDLLKTLTSEDIAEDERQQAEQNLTAIAAALKKGGNQDVTVHRLPEHNHLFQRARTGLMNEYGAIEETLSPKVLDLIRDWVLSVTQ